MCLIYGEPRPELSAEVLSAVVNLVIKPHQRIVRAYAYRGRRGGSVDHLNHVPRSPLTTGDVRISIETRRDRGIVEIDEHDESTGYCVYFKYGNDGRVREIILDESWSMSP